AELDALAVAERPRGGRPREGIGALDVPAPIEVAERGEVAPRLRVVGADRGGEALACPHLRAGEALPPCDMVPVTVRERHRGRAPALGGEARKLVELAREERGIHQKANALGRQDRAVRLPDAALSHLDQEAASNSSLRHGFMPPARRGNAPC